MVVSGDNFKVAFAIDQPHPATPVHGLNMAKKLKKRVG